MAFDDLSDAQLDLITKLAQKLATGKYRRGFRVFTQLMSAGPEIHLTCIDAEAVEPPIKHFRESSLDALKGKGYITLTAEVPPISHRFIGSLTTKAYQQYDLHTCSSTGLSRTITWLHISDLHFRTSQTYDANVVLQALLRDVSERIRQDGLRPDFIAVTGDVAFSGKPTEYDLARRFFDDLLKTTNLLRERLFLVPGNHDVNRGLVSRGAQGIADSLIDRDGANAVLANPADRQLMLARFGGYASFVNDYLGRHLSFDDEDYFYVHPLDLTRGWIALLGLNSAWLCASDEDKVKGLLIGERQTRAALGQADSADLKIALLHHPFAWLREFDQNDSVAMLLDNCHVILHGHMHQTAMTQLVSPDSGAMVIAGGACYETRKYPNMYNFVRLDLVAGKGAVHPDKLR